MKEIINKLADINNGLNRFEKEIKSIKKLKVYKSMLEEAGLLVAQLNLKLNSGEIKINERDIEDGN